MNIRIDIEIERERDDFDYVHKSEKAQNKLEKATVINERKCQKLITIQQNEEKIERQRKMQTCLIIINHISHRRSQPSLSYLGELMIVACAEILKVD